MFWNGKNRNKYYNFSSQFSIFEKFKIYKEKVASGHSSVCVCNMYVHATKREMFPSSCCLFKNISLVNTVSNGGGKVQKKNAVRLIGGKKKECTGLLCATESGENASFSYGHLGEIPPFTDNIPTKIY